MFLKLNMNSLKKFICLKFILVIQVQNQHNFFKAFLTFWLYKLNKNKEKRWTEQKSFVLKELCRLEIFLSPKFVLH